MPSSTSGSGGRSLSAARPRSGCSVRSTCCSGSRDGTLARNAVAARSSALAIAAPSRATNARAPASSPSASACRITAEGRPDSCSSSRASASAFAVSALGPRRDPADQDLQVVHGPDRDLSRAGIPAAPPFAQAAGERLEPGGGAGDRGLARHQRAAAQRPRQPHELVGRGWRPRARAGRPAAPDTPPPRGRRSRPWRAGCRAGGSWSYSKIRTASAFSHHPAIFPVAAASISCRMRRTASSNPQNTALLTMLWPMFSSSISGVAATGCTFW